MMANEGWSETERRDLRRIESLKAALRLIATGQLETDHGYFKMRANPRDQLARAIGIAEQALTADEALSTSTGEAPRITSFSSTEYWEQRYRDGGTSGDGSTGANAEFKAGFLNQFVKAHAIESVVEYGCGDGRQLGLADYPVYLGLDVSATAVELCRDRFKDDLSKAFQLLPYNASGFDLALSLDVIYHLVNDVTFAGHLHALFASSTRFVVVYTTDSGRKTYPLAAFHIRHRPVTAEIATRFPEWTLIEQVDNPAPELEGCDFYAYARGVE